VHPREVFPSERAECCRQLARVLLDLKRELPPSRCEGTLNRSKCGKNATARHDCSGRFASRSTVAQFSPVRATANERCYSMA